VAVGVLLAVLTVKRERDSGAFMHSPVNGVQPTEDFRERYLFEPSSSVKSRSSENR
jgi:hypothetical protein